MSGVCFLISNSPSIKAIIFNPLCSQDTFPSLTYDESHFFKIGFSHRTERLQAIVAMFYQCIHNIAKPQPFHGFVEDA